MVPIVVPIVVREEKPIPGGSGFCAGTRGTENVVAIVDIDCAEVDGFDEVDEEGLQRLATLIAESCEWNKRM